MALVRVCVTQAITRATCPLATHTHGSISCLCIIILRWSVWSALGTAGNKKWGCGGSPAALFKATYFPAPSPATTTALPPGLPFFGSQCTSYAAVGAAVGRGGGGGSAAAAAGGRARSPLGHALTMRPPRKVRPFSFLYYCEKRRNSELDLFTYLLLLLVCAGFASITCGMWPK